MNNPNAAEPGRVKEPIEQGPRESIGGGVRTRHKFHGKGSKECGVLFIARPSLDVSLDREPHSIIGKGLWYSFAGEKDNDGLYRILPTRANMANAFLHIGLEDAFVLACYPEPFTGGPPVRDERLAEFMETAVSGGLGLSFITMVHRQDEVYKPLSPEIMEPAKKKLGFV